MRGFTRACLLACALAVALCLGLSLAARLTRLPSFWTAEVESRGTLLSIRDRRGALLARMRTGDEVSLPVRLDAVDPIFIEATLAAEDRRFFRHPGVDPAAVVRSVWLNLRQGRRVSGGSTLTQQLVKMLQGWQSAERPGLAGKAAQAYWALVLEAHLSKEQILERYLNLAPYGPTERGVAASCRVYFGHAPDRLTLDEAALLAALPQSPVRHDPRRDPEAARRARNRVLRRMALPEDERAAAQARPLGLNEPSAAPALLLAPHWIERARRLWPEAAEIRLPLDTALQRAAQTSLVEALRVLGDAGADAGAVVALHNPTGEVRAWVGSPDWRNSDHGQFDSAAALRQPGSALKPFVYALAFEEGLRPSTLLPDLPEQRPGADGSFRPRNYSGAYHGPVRARAALANSWNAPAVALLEHIGPESLLRLLRDLGITSLNRDLDAYGLGLALGVGEVSLLELTDAYSTLARAGVRLPRIELLEVRDTEGGRLFGPALLVQPRTDPAPPGAVLRDPPAPSAERVLDPLAAFWTTSILSDEQARSRAFGLDGPFSFDFPVAIKTGTSSDWRDNWAFGYTPEWTVGVWVGAAAGSSMDRVSGTHGAILALRGVLLHLYPEGSPAAESVDFAIPDDLEARALCTLSGMEATSDCPEVVEEWFPVGDPTEPCAWHRRIPIDAASGLLARPCTPEGDVRRILYTIPTSPRGYGIDRDFDPWARDQNWPAPPLEWAECRCGACESREMHETAAREASDDPVSQGHSPGDRPRGGGAESPDGEFCRISRPRNGTVYSLDPSLPRDQQELALEGYAGSDPIRWRIDGQEFAVSRPGERVFWPLQPGRHRIRAERMPGVEERSAHHEITIEVDAGSE